MTTNVWMKPYEIPSRKALKLLLSVLTPEQRQTYADLGYIECTGSLGTRYRINRGHTYNVSWLNEWGREAGEVCATPDRWHGHGGSREMPDEDVMLGQLLSLVTDERAFLRIAHGPKPPVGRIVYRKKPGRIRRFFSEACDAIFGPT